MKTNLFAAAVAAILVLTGCETIPGGATSSVSPETINDIASCDGGVSSSITLNLKAEMQKQLTAPSGTFSAGLSDELAGIYAKKMPPADARGAAEDLRKCMQLRRDERKAEGISQCKAAWTCDVNQVASTCACRQELEVAQRKYGWNDRTYAQKYTEMCGPGITSIARCWPGGDIQQERARCESLLKERGTPLPVLDSASCKVSAISHSPQT